MSDETPAGQPGDVHSFFHININCTSFERSRAFYELLGFEVVLDFADTDSKTFGDLGLGPVLALPDNCDGHAALLMPKGRRDGPRIDLIEWISPKVEPQPRANLAQPGVGRICLRTLDADALQARLDAAGYRTYSSPARIMMGGSEIKVFCAEDPDGVVIEFMYFLRPAGSRSASGT